ncbi:MAG: hypothetical protein RLZZ385_405 [Pseudomonadota bacterium]
MNGCHGQRSPAAGAKLLAQGRQPDPGTRCQTGQGEVGSIGPGFRRESTGCQLQIEKSGQAGQGMRLRFLLHGDPDGIAKPAHTLQFHLEGRRLIGSLPGNPCDIRHPLERNFAEKLQGDVQILRAQQAQSMGGIRRQRAKRLLQIVPVRLDRQRNRKKQAHTGFANHDRH